MTIPLTLVDALRRHATSDADRPFVTVVDRVGRRAISYGELWKQALCVAAALREAGTGPGDVVILMLQHGPELYATFLGAMVVGATPSFMPYPTPKQKRELFWKSHRALFARIGPAVIVSYEDILDDIRGSAPPATTVMTATDMTRTGRDAPAPQVIPSSPTDIAFLQHSSGTTGLKKGVMLSHAAVIENARNYARAIGFDSTSVVASWLPLYHDMGLIACFMLPLVFGARVVHLDPFEWVGAPTSLLDEIEDARATHAWIPNFAFNHLALNRRRGGRPRWDLSSLKAMINCSEPCKSDSMEAFVAAYADSGVDRSTPQVCYAMAETVFAVTQTRLGEPPPVLRLSRDSLADGVAEVATGDGGQLVVGCGRPIPGVRVRIRAADGGDCADYEVGEICATSSGMYDGYFGLPDLTAEKLRDGWHHTGDLGFLHEGELFVTGRKDDLIIVRGRNYYAHDLEAIIGAVAGVKPGRVAVFAVDAPALGTAEVVCAVEIEQHAQLPEVRRAIKSDVESLSGLVLGKVLGVPKGSLHKTTSGKISREANRRAFIEGRLVTLERPNV